MKKTVSVGTKETSRNGHPIGILDLLPATEIVQINENQSIELAGLPIRVCANLMKRFPPISSAILGGAKDIPQIAALVPDAVDAIIAAGLAAAKKQHSTPEFEEAASFIAMEKQVDCLAAIGRCTFTKGYGPFVQKVKLMMPSLGDDKEPKSESGGKASDSNSPKPSNISAEQKNLPFGN